MKLKDVVKTKKQVEELGYGIENDFIEGVSINIVAHFGNITSFEVLCRNVCAMSGYNNIQNIGYIIKSFVELFEIGKEDGLRLSEIKNIPCRLVFEDRQTWGSKCIGFGHFMKDRFVLVKDFVKLDE